MIVVLMIFNSRTILPCMSSVKIFIDCCILYFLMRVHDVRTCNMYVFYYLLYNVIKVISIDSSKVGL